MQTIEDKFFTVKVLSQTPNPQQLVYAAMHQDYSSELVYDDLAWSNSISTEPGGSCQNQTTGQILNEEEAGKLIVKYLLNGNRGHFGPAEHPQIVFNFGYFPHSVMQQVRTHRAVSFDVQSFRYTSDSILKAAAKEIDIEEVFYLRPVGHYSDRQSKKYEYTLEQRQQDLEWCHQGAVRYAQRITDGLSEEHARGLIPFDVRQHWVMSGNARSIMHLLDIRGKLDVQPETRVMTEMMFEKFKPWMPEVSAWYEKNRWRKGILAP
jgi:thymidylate synthase (FAD)